MKLFKALCLLLAVLLSLAGCTDAHLGKTVFHTQNVISVTVYTHNASDGLIVPEDDLDAIVDWLGTFTVGKKADKALIPGSNSVSVRIEYADGVTVSSGLSTTTIDGTVYYMDHADAPGCYIELISG